VAAAAEVSRTMRHLYLMRNGGYDPPAGWLEARTDAATAATRAG
jgi:hypothetical protein